MTKYSFEIAVLLLAAGIGSTADAQGTRRIGIINDAKSYYRYYDDQGQRLRDELMSPVDARNFLEAQKGSLSAEFQSLLDMKRQVDRSQAEIDAMVARFKQTAQLIKGMRTVAADARQKAADLRRQAANLGGGFDISSSAGQAMLADRIRRRSNLNAAADDLDRIASKANQDADMAEQTLRDNIKSAEKQVLPLFNALTASYNARLTRYQRDQNDLARALQFELNRQNTLIGDHR